MPRPLPLLQFPVPPLLISKDRGKEIALLSTSFLIWLIIFTYQLKSTKLYSAAKVQNWLLWYLFDDIYLTYNPIFGSFLKRTDTKDK